MLRLIVPSPQQRIIALGISFHNRKLLTLLVVLQDLLFVLM